ncbi:MAG: tetratricopeptide repeat protein [Micromonosporaceae bacterium]|nr:tetratricopeptide repeat protein [Micromonosporaceae bacterium]
MAGSRAGVRDPGAGVRTHRPPPVARGASYPEVASVGRPGTTAFAILAQSDARGRGEVPVTRSGETLARLSVLGLVQLTIDRRSVPLTRLERTLLAGLAMSDGQPVSTSALAEWLWGDRPHASPRNRVQSLVSGIRRKTAPTEIVLTEGSAYRLAPAVACDVAECVRIRRQLSQPALTAEGWIVLVRRAAALVGGTPLDGCLDSPLLEMKRAQLEEEALQILSDRVETDIVTGDWSNLVAELTLLVERHPFHETLIGQLVRTLALTGRQAKALSVYRRAYRRMLDELGTPPSDPLAAIHEQVLRGDIAAPRRLPERGVFTPPTPRTVPRAVAEVVGRDTELAAIAASADPVGARPAVVSITGLGGVGKSTLAIESTHRLRDRFPDGSLYLDLDSETGRAGPSGVLALFLRLLGVSGEGIPDGHDARAALFRSVIDDKKILILLDDLPDGFDVRDIMPTRACSMAILTSRRPVTGAAPTLHLRLTSLSGANSVALLRSLLGGQRVDAAPDEAAELARTCGGMPLLLRVMGQRLAPRPDLSLGQAARMLADEIAGRTAPDDPEAAVLAGLGIAEAPLPEGARALLRDVARLPFPRAGRWVFRSLAAPENAGDRALDELVAAGFVDPVLREDADVQYQLHDLVRLHAGGAAETGGSSAGPVVRVVAERLLPLVEAHAEAFPAQLIPVPPDAAGERRDSPVDTPRPSPEAALRFFRTEHETILVTARDVSSTHPGLAWRLLALTGNHAHTALDPQHWLSTAHDVLPALSPQQADDARGMSYLGLIEASLRHELAESAASIPLAGRARRLLTRHRDTRGALVAAVILGRAHRALGERTRADAVLRWADRLCGPHTPGPTSGYIALAWGILCNDYDRLESALDHCQRSVSRFELTGDWLGLARARTELGVVLRRLRRYPEGLQMYDSAMTLFTRLGNHKGCTAALDGRADLVTQMGQPASALADATEAVRRSAQARDAFLLHRAQRTLGRVYTGLGRFDDAAAALAASASGFEAMSRPLSLAGSLRDLARLYQLQQRHDDARRVLLRERDCLLRAGVEGPTAANPSQRDRSDGGHRGS